MNIDDIVAKMPKAPNPGRWHGTIDKDDPDLDPKSKENLKYFVFDAQMKYQCRFLAEQGYRRVPSVEEIGIFLKQHYVGTNEAFRLSKLLHRWWLEGG